MEFLWRNDEVVAEDPGVQVGYVDSFLFLDPGVFCHQVLEAVGWELAHYGLLEFVLGLVSEDFLEQQEPEELGVKVRWGFVENCHIDHICVLGFQEQHAFVESGF